MPNDKPKTGRPRGTTRQSNPQRIPFCCRLSKEAISWLREHGDQGRTIEKAIRQYRGLPE